MRVSYAKWRSKFRDREKGALNKMSRLGVKEFYELEDGPHGSVRPNEGRTD